ncbi:MAG TPA: integrase [Candidatus Binatia bacterium]|nr:integrase [Candidatus Binatia bacterium]
MSLSAKREYLAKIHGRYQRAGRPHKSRILDEFCANCGYHRKAALRLLHRPLASGRPKRSGPKPIYEPAEVLPVLKAVWLASDQLCSKLLRAALPEWLAHHERRFAPLPGSLRKKLLAISPAQIDRLLRPVRVRHPRKGLSATRPGTLLRRQVPTRGGPPDTRRPGSVEADTVAHCGETTAGNYVNSLTFTELFSGWTENRAVWNKSGQAIRDHLQELEQRVPFEMKDFHTDNGSEFLNWALLEHLTGRPVKLPWTRSRAYRKNDNAHCEQKNWTHVRQLFGHERFGHPELVPLMNDLYVQEWSRFTNHFRPTFKLLKRDKRGSKTVRIYEKKPQTPYQRLLDSPDIQEAQKAQLRAKHEELDPFELKKSIETKLKKFFTALGNLDRESTKT